MVRRTASLDRNAREQCPTILLPETRCPCNLCDNGYPVGPSESLFPAVQPLMLTLSRGACVRLGAVSLVHRFGSGLNAHVPSTAA